MYMYNDNVFYRKLDIHQGTPNNHIHTVNTVNRIKFSLDSLQGTMSYNSNQEKDKDTITSDMNMLAIKWSAIGIQIPLERETLCQSLALVFKQIAPFYK